MRGSNESNKFDACISESQRLHREIEDSQQAEWRKFHQQQELRTEVDKLQQEQELNEHEHSGAVKCDHRIGSSHGNAGPDGEMRRQEHYREWLATQVVLNLMCEGDITETGFSNIPAHDKQAGYPGYPQSENSDHRDENATPGPSRPHRHNNQEDIHETRNRNSNHRSRSSKGNANKNNHLGNDPSDPSNNNSLSDSTSGRRCRPTPCFASIIKNGQLCS